MPIAPDPDPDPGHPRPPFAAGDAAGQLLDREAPDLSPKIRVSVLAEAAGNPLGLLELARAAPLSAETLAAPQMPLSIRLERAFASRLDELSAEARVVFLAAALDNDASIEELLDAATRVHGEVVPVAALDDAVALGLADVAQARVRFHHPLIRSAVQQAAAPTQVLAMYAALADVVADQERRLWHRAMAAVGPDEQVAADLEEHARAARRRGAVPVAAAALERAALLSADPHTKGDRLVRAAELAYDLGLVEVVRDLLRQAERVEVGPLETARFAWLQQMISGDVWSEAGATKTFVTIAEQMLARFYGPSASAQNDVSRDFQAFMDRPGSGVPQSGADREALFRQFLQWREQQGGRRP